MYRMAHSSNVSSSDYNSSFSHSVNWIRNEYWIELLSIMIGLIASIYFQKHNDFSLEDWKLIGGGG